jgi:tryptophan 2-monooxygenase
MPGVVPSRAPHAAQTVPNAFPGWPFLDTLYHYENLLKPTPMAVLPQDRLTAKVAIIGAGAAGMCAAYELLRMGLSPTVFEASDRIGGRNWSSVPIDAGDDKFFFEMGAMRFPPSSRVFMKYANMFDVEGSDDFPDPGKVLTLIHYEDEALQWEKNTEPPHPFAKIKKEWEAFIHPVLVELVKAFGALGIGSGGFSPLYSIGFLEILRIIANGLENNQKFIPGGVGALTDGFHRTMVPSASGPTSLEVKKSVRRGHKVTGIALEAGPPKRVQLTVKQGDKFLPPEIFDAVIVATTTKSMQAMGLVKGSDILAQPVLDAVEKLNMISSSKLFISTQSKFWKTDDEVPAKDRVPANIQTDKLPRGVYALDYSGTDKGVVLVSYTWAEDSDKVARINKQERLARFVKELKSAHAGFANSLEPVDQQSVDWQNEPGYCGAFKLNLPGQDHLVQSAYFQFQTAGTENDNCVYLAGDGISWTGGWTEGALQTALNAVCAVAKHLGANPESKKSFPHGSPFEQKKTLYRYEACR